MERAGGRQYVAAEHHRGMSVAIGHWSEIALGQIDIRYCDVDAENAAFVEVDRGLVE